MTLFTTGSLLALAPPGAVSTTTDDFSSWPSFAGSDADTLFAFGFSFSLLVVASILPSWLLATAAVGFEEAVVAVGIILVVGFVVLGIMFFALPPLFRFFDAVVVFCCPLPEASGISLLFVAADPEFPGAALCQLVNSVDMK